MALSDREGTVLAANEAYLELYGLTEDEVVGKDFSVIFPEDAREDARQGYRQVFDAASPPSTHRSEVVRSDGSTRVVESRIAFVTQEGRRTAMLSIIRDVTEREEHARALEVALSERETLLRELYHRTKNNMQVIESMIALEASQADQRAPGELFSALTSRIHAMGLVHQKLYQSSDLTKIQLDEYLRDLITVILAATDAGERVQPRMDVTSVAVSIEIAVPLGLVLNELITNAAKHAFPDSATGTISISARLEGSRLVVTVEDDGVGLPADASSLATSSMGMGIATSIVEGQLGGSVRFENAPGVRCVIDVDTGSYSVAGASLPDSNERSDRTRNDNTLN
jgi:PAS domain S-box-containing protein